jgi:hypothetical protein
MLVRFFVARRTRLITRTCRALLNSLVSGMRQWRDLIDGPCIYSICYSIRFLFVSIVRRADDQFELNRRLIFLFILRTGITLQLNGSTTGPGEHRPL